jgi:Tfp pilus assembly protein PilV
MRKSHGAGPQAGFTLIESMIAMLFLSYIVGQMAMLTVYASRNTNFAQRVTRANALADEAVEKSRNSSFNNLQLPLGGLGETCTMAANVATCTSSLDAGRYTRARRVSPWTIDYTTNTYTSTPVASSNQADVDVTVSFVDANGNAQAIRVVSIVSRY